MAAPARDRLAEPAHDGPWPDRAAPQAGRRRRPRPLSGLRVALRRHRRQVALGGLALLAIAGVSVLAVATPGAIRQQVRRADGSLVPHVPSSAAPAPALPADLALRDQGGSITVSWDDPSHGVDTAVVSLSPAGRPAIAVVTLPQGASSYTATGLDSSSDYCFLVALLAPHAASARTTSVCTTRGRSAGAPASASGR